tara:strand:+ start:3081 stop:6092 length:3012 start_codon:yes stop_codon:yes gene_type:complete
MAGYARTNTADIQSGQVVKSAPINAELNAIVTAFAFSGGHNHDGSSTEGAYVGLIADTDALNKVVVDTSNNRVGFFSEVSSAAVEQIRIQDGSILPVTDNDIDLGASGTEFKDLYLDGTAHVDTLDVDENATIAGTLGVTGAVTANAGVVVDNITIDGTEIDLSSGDLTLDVAGDIILDADGADVLLKDAGTQYAALTNSSGNLIIKSGSTTALTFSGANVTAAGEVSMTTLDIGGTNVTSTAAELNILDGVTATTSELNIMDGVTATTSELNIMDGVTSTTAELNIVDGDTSATSTTVADADRVVMNDNGTMVQVAVTDLAAYFDDEITAMPNLVTTAATTVGALDSGSITSGFGNIDIGSDNLTATGTVSLGATSFNDNAITNVGDIALDSISADGTDINVAVSDNSATAFTIKQGSDAYLIIDTANSSESVSIGTGISGTAITIGHGTSEVTIGDNLTVTGNLTVSGTQTVVDTVTMNAQNAIVFEGATADAHETTLTITDPTADRTIKLPNQSGTLPVLAADSDTAITSTPAELNILDGVTATTAELNILDGVTSTATELNIVDGNTSATSTTVADADRVVLNDNGTMVQVAVTDLAAYFDDEITAMPNLVTTAATTVGALDSGSITSGFGTIDTGSSTITTTGLITGGSLDIDDVLINGSTIGHTDDTDLITLANGVATVAGELSVTTLDIGGTNVTATAAELNVLDGIASIDTDISSVSGSDDTLASAKAIKTYVDDNRNVTGLNATGAELNTVADNSAISVDTSTAVANNDGILMFDTSATAAKYFDVDLLDTYFAGTTKTLTNKTLTAPKFADGGFIADANGNELIMLQTASSAVNQLEVTNSASGGSVVVGASGDDSNIDIDISPKGTGEVNIAASNLNYGGTAVTSTGAELNLVDGSSAGTIVNSKAVIYGSSGEVNATTLQIGGTSINATAAELNIMDGGTAASSTTLADADRLVTNDNGTMKQVALTDLKTYLTSAGFTTDDPTALAIALG